jgi:AcrR family transcriptional regulator
LFVEHGYAATTIESIAQEAGVGVSTVYAVYGNKRELLAELRRRWFDEADVEVLVAEALAIQDPHAKLRLCAQWVRRQMEVGLPVAAVIEEASRVDPLARDYLADLRRKPEAKVVELVHGLAAHLAPDVSEDDAVAIVWALTQGSTFRELCQRGWSADRYEAWLADALEYQLLGCPVRASALP